MLRRPFLPWMPGRTESTVAPPLHLPFTGCRHEPPWRMSACALAKKRDTPQSLRRVVDSKCRVDVFRVVFSCRDGLQRPDVPSWGAPLLSTQPGLCPRTGHHAPSRSSPPAHCIRSDRPGGRSPASDYATSLTVRRPPLRAPWTNSSKTRTSKADAAWPSG